MKVSELTWPRRYGQRLIALAAAITMVGFAMAMPVVMVLRDLSFSDALFEFLYLGVPSALIGASLSALAVTPGKNVWKPQWPESGQ